MTADRGGPAQTRYRRLLSVDDWSRADLGDEVCAFVYWRGATVKVVVSDRTHQDLVELIAFHALTHCDNEQPETWGETTAWCELAHCWAAQTWLPNYCRDVSTLAAPA